MKYFTKTAFFGWGGRSTSIPLGKEDSPVRIGAGYSNIMGVVPVPIAYLRLGKPKGFGVSVGGPTSMISIDTGASKSFKDRPKLKGLLDIFIEKIENLPEKDLDKLELRVNNLEQIN